MKPIRDVHHSGFAGAPVAAWRRLIKADTQYADLIALTECRRDIAPAGWDQYRPHGPRGAECTVLWNASRFRAVEPRADCRGATSLTRRTFFTGRGVERPGVVATWILLHDNHNDLDVLRIVAHMPASVQNGNRFSAKVRRVIAWRSALAGLRRLIRELDRELQPHDIIVSADWNVDFTRRRWRVLVNAGLRGAGLRLKAPHDGTHHKRAIDSHATTMRRAHGVLVLPKLHGFDHRPVLATLTTRRHR